MLLGSLQHGEQLNSPALRRVLGHHPRAGRAANSFQLRIGQIEGRQSVIFPSCNKDLVAGSEEVLQSPPIIAQNYDAAGGRLK